MKKYRKTHREFLEAWLSDKKDMTIAEIGIFAGATCDYLLNKCTPSIKEYWAIDPWKKFEDKKYGRYTLWGQEEWDERYKNVCKLMIKYNKLKVIRLGSEECSKLFDSPYFDFVFIDADHFYDKVILDIKSWYPIVKNGGWISGHDYNLDLLRKDCGVKKAVNEIFRPQDILELGDGIWMVKKLTESLGNSI